MWMIIGFGVVGFALYSVVAQMFEDMPLELRPALGPDHYVTPFLAALALYLIGKKKRTGALVCAVLLAGMNGLIVFGYLAARESLVFAYPFLLGVSLVAIVNLSKRGAGKSSIKTRRLLSKIIRVATVGVWIVSGILSVIIDLMIVNEEWGFLGVVAAFVLAPVTLMAAPWYALVEYGTWTPLLISYGGVILAALLGALRNKIEQNEDQHAWQGVTTSRTMPETTEGRVQKRLASSSLDEDREQASQLESVEYLRSLPYKHYLGTRHWQEIRQRALDCAGYRCQVCNRVSGTLSVHHRTYENLAMERDSDLIVLCGRCYELFHNRLDRLD